MADPVYKVGLTAFFKDLGAVRGLGALTGATNNLASATSKLRDKTMAVTGSVRRFGEEGHDVALSMSTNLRRTAVLQGKVASRTKDIAAMQFEASAQTGQTISNVQELQREFEAVGKAAVGNLPAFTELQTVLEVPSRTIASWDKTLEAQGLTEKQVIGLTKELGGLATQLGVPPGPLLEQMPDLTKLIMERAAILGKEGPKFIRRYLRENIGLSAALTSTGLSADEAAGSVVSLGRLTFDSAKEMKKALAGVGNTDLPQFLKMASITTGDFQKAFQLAAEKGPLALAQEFANMTDQIRKDSHGNVQVMERWRAFMDETIGDPALASAIIDQQKAVGKAIKAVDMPANVATAHYDRMAEAILKSADSMKAQSEASMVALKALINQESVLPTMTKYWEFKAKALNMAREAIQGWTKDAGPATQMTLAAGAGVFAFGGDILEWTIKAGGAIKNLREFGSALSGMTGIMKGGVIPAMANGVGSLSSFALFVRGTLIPTIQIGASSAFATFASTITGTVLPAMSSFLIAAGPILAIAAAITAAIGGVLYLYQKHAEAAGAAGQSLGKMSAEVLPALMKSDPQHAKAVSQEMMGKSDEDKMRILGRERTMLVGRGALPAQAMSPTPVLASSAFPPGASGVRVAIQGLEEQRAQTHLLEQIAMLLGGVGGGGGGTPGRGGGGGVTVEIRPDSGPMQLHKMLRATARSTMGRTGYNQFGGTAFAN